MKLSLKRSFLLVSFFLCFCFFSTSTFSYGMVIAPSKINLNAECVGINQDVQAIISEIIPGTFLRGTMSLYISFDETACDDGYTWEEEAILTTTTIRYCPIDDNLLISFDRCELQEILDDLDLECPINASVLVSGSYFYEVSDGSHTEVEVYLDGCDDIDIIKPGSKK